MSNLINKNKGKIIISLVTIIGLFFSLSFFNGKGNKSLTERDRRLMNYDHYQDGDELVDGTDYVTFDAYFYENINGTPTKIRGEYLNVNDKAELWLDLHVFGDVTLKDARISLVNGNVVTGGYLYKSTIIPKNTSVPNGGNIVLNPSISGATLNNKITITSNLTNDLNSLSNSTNKVILTGTLVKPDGEEVSIRKEVSYTVDWYLNDLSVSIGKFKKDSQSFPYNEVFGCEDQTLVGSVKAYYHVWNGENYKLRFSLTTTSNSPFLKSANIEVVIPQLNGYDPVSVTMNNYGVTYNYDETTRTLTATKEAVLEDTLLTTNAYSYRTSGVSYNEWTINVEYPREVEEESQTMLFNTKAWYEEYKYNDNSQIEVVTSDVEEKLLNAAFIKPTIRKEGSLDCGKADRVSFGRSLTIGSYSSLLDTYYINKTGALKKYNGEDGATDHTDYSVSWSAYLNYFDRYDVDTITSVTMSDTGSDYAGSYSLDGIAKYKSIRVSSANYWLGTNGYIKIINNDTNELIHILTALDWDTPYTFETDVSSIRLETSELVNKEAMEDHAIRYGWQDTHLLHLFGVSIVKTLDHDALMNTYDLDTFNTMSYISTRFNVSGVRHRTEENTNQNVTGSTYYNSASLRTMQSAEVTIDTNKTSIESTQLNDTTFTIKTGDYHDVVEGYKNAEFLMTLPEWILDFEINSVVSSKNTVKITGYEKVDLGNGQKAVRIITANDIPEKYDIDINLSLVPDARQMSKSGTVSLYATNPSTNLSNRSAKDIYDVDQDGDTNEYQNYASKSIALTAPNEIITTTTINYKDVDENGVTVVSPMVADVNPLEDHTDAEIEIGITNNSLYPTQDISVIGKIGFVGNTYQIGDGDLGSEFNVKMTDAGISIPEELEGKVTIYYSDKETPTDDVNDANNNWKTKENVADFNNIKTYMIIIDDYTLPVGSNIAFTYDIEMPNTTADLNKKTYFTHGVYYNIVTNAGLLPSSVGGAKLGIRVSRRYNASITDLKMGSERPIAGSKYVIASKDDQDNIIDQKIITTDANGNAIAKNLYAGYTYEITQTSVKYPYILDEQVRKFTVTNDANDVLSLTTEGTYKSAELTNNHLVSLVLANETRYNIILKDTDLDTNENIAYSRFKITGKGYEEGIIVGTNTNGELQLNGLYLDEVYTVQQLSANKYLLADTFTLKLTRDNNGDVKIAVKKVAGMGAPVTIGDYGYNRYRDYYEPSNRYNGKHTAAYFPIDLTGFTDNFTITLAYQWYARYSGYDTFKLYLTDNITDLSGLTGASPFLSRGYNTSSSKTNIIPTTYNAYNESTNTYTQKAIESNKQYYLYVDFYYRGYGSYAYVYDPTFVNSNGDNYEYLINPETTNVATYENQYALQTIEDSDNQDAPVLRVSVKNVKIPTYTLELTKEDAESHETLAGAQYKITGPGLPAAGKYITTDEFGKATVELQKVYSNKNINGINYTEVQGEYTIEEVVAPIGYILDDKSVTFVGTLSIQNGAWNNNTYETDMSTEKNNTISYSINSESKFKATEWDNDNNVLKVTMYDYPIVKITKTDAETGEVLPNTLFAIYEVTTVNGNFVYTPARDANGEYIGSDVTIDGKDYKVIATDENGNLNLNLGAGSYMLQEIQAADEKYSLSGTKYNFGIGETVPYQAAGIDVSKSAKIDYFGAGSGSNKSSFVKPTSDGGWISVVTVPGPWPDYIDNSYLTKYNADLTVAWSVHAELYFSGTELEVKYFDKPGETVVWTYPPGRYAAANVIETSDGGFVVRSSNYNVIAKYDKDGNFLWQNQQSYYTREIEMDHYCTFEGNTNEQGQVAHYVYNVDTKQWEQQLNANYNSETGEYDDYYVEYYDLQGYEVRDAETYYCHQSGYYGYVADEDIPNITSFCGLVDTGRQRYACSNNHTDTYYNTSSNWTATIVPAPDGGVYIIRETSGYGGNSYYRLSDGTLLPYSDYSNNVLLKYDADGNFVGVYDLSKMLKDAEIAYMEKYNLTTSVIANVGDYNLIYNEYDSVFSYPNGDILVLSQNYKIAAKFTYNAVTNKFDTVFYTPISINGRVIDTPYDNVDYTFDIKLTDDGGFILGTETTRGISTTGSTNDYYNVGLQTIEDDNLFYRESNYGNYFMKFDGTGKLVDIRLATSTYRDLTNNYEDDIVHIFGGLSGGAYVYLPEDDSYIFATTPDGLYNYSINGVSTKVVELANGEMVAIDPQATYIFYKVNNEQKVEWVKQYKGMTKWYNYSSNFIKMYLSSDGKRIGIPVRFTTNDPIVEIGNDDIPVIQGEAGSVQLLLFEISDEVTPSGPEAYTLNIENKRKEYKVTTTSNIGGEVKITKPDDTEEVINNGTIETVKYGDDNVNVINIKPNPGYVIKSVKVNDKEIGYTVNDDASITLDTIKDIKENKNINITYEYGLSTVIVKHYLNGTTDSVFSDEILTGQITTPYKAEPKSDYLYSVAEENGEVILPDNMEGEFTLEPQTVIFYYVENEVELKTNYYIDGTDTELAPSNIERKVLGSTYQTAPLNITNYELSRTLGEESGTLNNNTEVTYMYQELTESKITIRYVDKDTNQDIIDPIIKTVTRHEPYTTDDPVTLPSNYRFTSVSGDPAGTADDAEIEVIYYYEVIPFNVKADKKINSVLLNGEKQTINDSKNVVISPFKKDNLIVYYEINVENTGEIKATFKIVEEDIPGFEIYDKGEFTKTDAGYELNVELEPGAKASYKIGYKWNQKDYGISTNKVELKEVTNPNGFDEPDSDDNISKATVETTIPEDVLDEDVIIPNTIDKIRTSIALFITSLCGVIVTIILMRKKRMN